MTPNEDGCPSDAPGRPPRIVEKLLVGLAPLILLLLGNLLIGPGIDVEKTGAGIVLFTGYLLLHATMGDRCQAREDGCCGS
uniref:Aa_trans domain-containing protein n=1 Tax=Steinernema glaseri TaxID=37863 RepID=A0A1I7Z975_9BILA